MSQCPLGFKGTPPIGHPPVPGMHTGDSTKASAHRAPRLSDMLKNQYLILLLEVLFLLMAVYIARNGFPSVVTKTLGSYLPRTSSSATSTRARVPTKSE